MNYDKLTKEQLLGILKDTLEYINEQEKELDKFRPFTSAYEMKKEIKRLNKMLEKKFMEENPFIVENGIICKKNKEIERLTAESTEWESKFYDEAKKNDRAIEYCKELMLFKKNSRQYLIGKCMLETLGGVDKE